MNKSAFIRFGIIVFTCRCFMALCTIIIIILAIDVKNRSISPIREWLSDVMVYSVFTSLLVLSVSIVDIMDYSKKNLHVFKKIAKSKQNIRLRLYIIVTAVEAIILSFYCANLHYTLQTVSVEVKNVLYAGLSKYLTNTSWRTFWNQFQTYYYCCGSSQSTDWFQTAWISPNTVPSFSLLNKYIQENKKLIISAAPVTCCLPNTTCNTFTDCDQPDPNKYYQIGCFTVIDKTINSLSATKYLFYAVLIMQIISTVVKYEGYTESNDNSKT